MPSRKYSWVQFQWILSLIVIAVTTLIVYEMQLQYSNAYIGFLPLSYANSFGLVVPALIIVLGMSMPKSITKPSHLFYVVYGTFVILSYILFARAAKDINILSFSISLILLIIPNIIIYLITSFKWRAPININMNPDVVMMIVFGIAATGAYITFFNAGSSSGLSVEDMYVRRLEARDIFQSGSLLAYFNVITMNGINPFLAFLGGLTRRHWVAACSLIFGFVSFYSIGAKQPLVFIMLSYAVGVGLRSGKTASFFKVIFLLTIIFFAVFLIEYWESGFSTVAEYFFRRIYAIPGFEVQLYMELLFEDGGNLWSPMSGIKSDLGATFLIGLLFEGNMNANVNTNAFTIALANGGYPLYFATTVLVGSFMKLLDALYEANGNAGYMYLSFIYSFLLVEQSATTALVSSGVALLLVLVMLSGKGWQTQRSLAYAPRPISAHR